MQNLDVAGIFGAGAGVRVLADEGSDFCVAGTVGAGTAELWLARLNSVSARTNEGAFVERLHGAELEAVYAVGTTNAYEGVNKAV